MKRREFLRSFASVGALTVLEQIVGVVLGIMLANWLGLEGYGVYAFAMAIHGVLLVPGGWGLAGLLLRESATARVGKETFEVHAMRRQSGLAVLLASTATALVAGLGFTWLYDGPALQREAVIIALLILPIYALLTLAASGLRGAGRVKTGVILSTLAISVTVAGLLAWAHFFGTSALTPSYALTQRLLATMAAAGLCWYVFLRLPGGHNAAAQRPSLRQLFRSGFPFMVLGGSAILMSRSDVVLLGFFGTASDVGLYNVALQAAFLITFSLTTANLIATQEYARLHASGEIERLERFARLTARVTFLIGLAVLAVLLLTGEWLITRLFGPDFSAGYPLLVILALGKTVSLVFGEPGFILNMAGHERTTVRIFGGAALLNVVLCAIAIPLWGASGAAYAAIVSHIIWRGAAWYGVRKKVGISCAIF